MKRDVSLLIGGAIIGAIGSLVVNLATGWFQTKEARLVYEANETLPIQEKEQSTAIYHITIDNLGNKDVEDVVCNVSVPGGKIERHKVYHPPSMQNTEEVRSDSLNEKFNGINPNDPVQISVLASGSTPLPPKATVSLRGKGVVGVEKSATSPQQGGNFTSQWLQVLILPFFVSLTFSMYSIYNYLAKKVGSHFSKMEIEIKIPDDNLVKVKVIKGFGASKGWVSLTGSDKHDSTGYYCSDLRKLGDGKHTVQIR